MAEVLVTGAAGFLGSAVCQAARVEGSSVIGLVRPGELARPIEGVIYRELDWGDDTAVRAAFAAAAPERIVHCAGATPRASISTSALYEANVGLVWRLLEHVASEVPAAGVVIVSSAAVYGSSPGIPTTEEEPLDPSTHYAWSKVMAEQAARAFASVEGVHACIARPFNLLGAGEPRGSVVSDVIEQIEADAEVIRVRETASVRDFIDVDDAARALLLLAERGEPGQAYNVCSGRGVPIGGLVSALLKAAGSHASIAVADPHAQGSTSTGAPARLVRLGWRQSVALDDSLARTLASVWSPRHR